MAKIDTSAYPEPSVDRYVPPPHNQELPHDFVAEQCVLGCIMLEPDSWDQAISIIQKDDFFDINHKIIFDAYERIKASNRNIDVITVQSQLIDAGALERVGGQEYLLNLQSQVPSGASVGSYASVVREHSIKRRVLACCSNLTSFVFSNKGVSAEEVLHKAESEIFAVAEKSVFNDNQGPKSLETIVPETLDRIGTNVKNYESGGSGVTGISTGFRLLDSYTLGYHEGELIILAARPGMGKTTLGMNMVESAFLNRDNHTPVLVFSLEMPAWSIVLRMISSLSDVKFGNLNRGNLTGEEMKKLAQAVSVMNDPSRQHMLYIDDQPGLTPNDVRVRAKKIAKEHGGLSLIMLDYLQLLSIPGFGTDKQHEVSEISKALKQIARELKVPIIALSQLSRGVESRTDKRPNNSDLRESGAIEQDADLIMFIYRDDYYHKDSKDQGLAEVIISKQRNGPTGTIKLVFDNEYSRFSNLIDDDPAMEPRPSDLKYGS